MKSLLALAPAALAGAAAAQNGNDVPLHNGTEVLLPYSNPSVGFPVGTVPPDALGDLHWKVYGGEEILACGGDRTIEVDGFFELLFDTANFQTPPDFCDRALGPALESVTTPGNLEPAFLQLGFTTETILSLGNSGLPPACSVAPSLCSPPGGTCPPPGFVNGYTLDIEFGNPPLELEPNVVVPCDGTPASNLAVTYFLPGGMPFSGPPCDMGMYVLQDTQSNDETNADLAGLGVSRFGGRQIAGQGPTALDLNHIGTYSLRFREKVLNVFADSGTGLGAETPDDNDGGAQNGLALDTSSGNAQLGVKILAKQAADNPNLAFAAASFSPSAPVTLPFVGDLLVSPDFLFFSTLSVWMGQVQAVVPLFTEEGIFASAMLAVPPVAAPLDLYLQGGVIDLACQCTLPDAPGEPPLLTNRVRVGLR